MIKTSLWHQINNQTKTEGSFKKIDIEYFYKGFTDSVREIKDSLDGKIKLKEAKSWLNEIPG